MKRAGKGALIAGAAGTFGISALQAACSDSSNPDAAPAGAAGATPGPTSTPVPQRYSDLRSRPDLNNAPTLRVVANTGRAAPGYLFLSAFQASPPGPALFDDQGRLVWFNPVAGGVAFDFKVVRYQGADHLAWFEGSLDQVVGVGSGAYTLHDEQYRAVTRISAGGGAPLDFHELNVTPSDTALICVYQPVTMDLSSLGGLPDASVLDSVVQEIDIATGGVVFEWHALDHVGLEESVSPMLTEPGSRYDYFHINAIEVDTDGNLLVSGRNTCAVYKVHRTTGEVIWRIVGSDAVQPPAPYLRVEPTSASFFYQHDVRRNPDGTISIFDNGGYPYQHNGRALLLDIDETGGSAIAVKEFGSDLGQHAAFAGSARQQPHGNMLVGWGSDGRLTEFTPEGDICFDATFSGVSYRALRFDWTGTPVDPPDIAVAREGDGARVWSSWNGSTEVRRWRVLGGSSADSLAQLIEHPWEDFETEIRLDRAYDVIAVEALDGNGATLDRSAPTQVI